jgi:hypothetical protein
MIKVEVDTEYTNEDLQEKLDKRQNNGWELLNVAPNPKYEGLHNFYWKKET